MPLETASTIAELNSSWPLGSSDTPASIDNHIQLIKSVLKADGMGASTVHAATSKATPVDADEIPLADSATSWGLKKLTWANFKATAKAYFDTLYSAKGDNSDITSLSGLTTPLTVPQGGSGVATLTGLVKGNGGSAFSAAVAGTDYAASGGNIIEKTAAGIGYGPGAGGTVTQATSKSTAVTLDKPTGRITMNNAALAAGASVYFNLNNSVFGLNDICLVQAYSFTNYRVEAITSNVGVITIRVINVSAGSLSDAVPISFAIIKGATS